MSDLGEVQIFPSKIPQEMSVFDKIVCKMLGNAIIVVWIVDENAK